MGGVYWTNKSKTEPCYPQFNSLGYYVGRSKVEGIHTAYESASTEIIEWGNRFYDKINALQSEIERLTKAEKQANVKVEELKPAKEMAGRKTKYLLDVEVEKAKRMRAHDMSFEQIGKALGVSSRTVRRAVNGEKAYMKLEG